MNNTCFSLYTHNQVHTCILYSMLKGHTTHHWASCPTDVATVSVTEATHPFRLLCPAVLQVCWAGLLFDCGGCTMHLLHSVGYTYCIVRACALSVVPCVLSGTGLTSTCYPGLVYRPLALVSYCMYVCTCSWNCMEKWNMCSFDYVCTPEKPV